MITGLMSFLGTSVFKLIFGEIMSLFTAHQETKQELARMEAQGALDAAQHLRNMQSTKLQADLGVKTIEVQAEADLSRFEAEGWLAAVKGTTGVTGYAIIDIWNGAIRPGVATWAIVMVSGNYMKFWTLDENGWSLCGAALGLYLASRDLFKRGK